MSNEDRPMTAQARYLANLVKRMTPEGIADLVAAPPGNRAKEMAYDKIHAMVMGCHAPDHVKDEWLGKLADAADTDPKEGWSPAWSTPIAKLLDLVPEDAPKEEKPARAPKAPPVADVTAMESRQAA